ncbi:alpha/beta fold hydrolase [Streptomyces sp. NBC_01092]|uniref:alpha/beta fold hydrolase n=1 Tax=Streptomyces sp. NBC_01092 TaxID=2903748 RepID=UPI0038660504|nr:alpha/beta hydrolase [Streptomyces sp. NBC_01092]
MITRRTFTGSIVAAGASSSLAAAEATAAPQRRSEPPAVRNVVLVHGAYADGSCWSEVIERLQSAGMNVTSVQNPLTSLADDVAATERALALQDGPTILAAHSWGGTVISQAGLALNVNGLVYIAARAPDAGEDYTALAARFPTPPANAELVESGGFKHLTKKGFLRDFAGGVPRPRALALHAAQGPVAASLFPTSTTTTAAWRHKPSWYAVSAQDRTTSPDLQRFLAMRMRARTVELPTSHLSIVTHPDAVTDLILEAADSS